MKARLEINSETVKPMPATAPPPTSEAQLSEGRGPCSAGREAIQVAPTMPSGLPSTYPSRIPSVIGEVTASPSRPPRRWTPALASAKTGTNT